MVGDQGTNQDMDVAVGILNQFAKELPPHILVYSQQFSALCSYLVSYYLPSSPPDIVPELSKAFNQEIETIKETREGVGLALEVTQYVCQTPQNDPAIQEGAVKALEGFMRLDSNLSNTFKRRSIYAYQRYTDTHKFLYEKVAQADTQQEVVSRVWRNYCQLMEDQDKGTAPPFKREALLRYQNDLTWVEKTTHDAAIQKGAAQSLAKIEQELMAMPVRPEKAYDVPRPTLSIFHGLVSFETH